MNCPECDGPTTVNNLKRQAGRDCRGRTCKGCGNKFATMDYGGGEVYLGKIIAIDSQEKKQASRHYAQIVDTLSRAELPEAWRDACHQALVNVKARLCLPGSKSGLRPRRSKPAEKRGPKTGQKTV